VTAAAGPGPSTRADPFAPAGGKQLPAGFGADREDQIQMPASGGSTVQLWLCCWPVLPGFSLSSVHGRSRFRHPDSHRSATSKGGKGNPPSGGGGRSAGSPPPGTGHPDPGWRASAPPPASGAFWEGIERPGWRDPEASSDVLRGQEFLQGHFQLKLGRDVFAAISRWTTRTRVLRLFLHR
jgi:hypothetical protein